MKLTIYQMEQSSVEFKKTHTVNVSGKSKEGKMPKWFSDFYYKEFKPLQEAFIKSQTQAPSWFKEFVNDEFKPAIASINSRIDNLVKINNLKE